MVAPETTANLPLTYAFYVQMTDDKSLFFGKMCVGHGRLLLVLSWSCFSIYQKSCYVLLQ